MATSTRTEHSATLTDGRRLAVSEYGDPSGPAVVLLPSAPGSRLIDPDPAVTAASGVRLLVVDRPGYGRSDALAAEVVPTLPLLADSVAEALAALGVTDAGVVGWSSGGHVALALAARHPQAVRALVLVGTPAPDDEVPWVGAEHRQALRAMRERPEQATAAMAGQLTGAAGDPSMVAGGPADEAALADPSVRDRVAAMLSEGLRPGPLGMAADIVAVHVSPPGFDPASVGARTTLVYGQDDVIVPPEHGRWWASRVPDAALSLVPDSGHLVLLTAWADVLDAVR